MTVSQVMVGVGFNVGDGNGEFKILCNDFEDFKKCLKEIGEYNDFNPYVVIKEFEQFPHPDGTRYFVGREYSPVIYIELQTDNELYDQIFSKLAENTKADEYDNKGDGSYRFWWD
jgi:hypothetical protein